MSHYLIDSANIKIIIRTAKGMAQILHECLTRGLPMKNFWCVQKKIFLDDEENPNRFVAVIADKLCQRGYYSYYRLQLLQITVSKTEKRQGGNNM